MFSDYTHFFVQMQRSQHVRRSKRELATRNYIEQHVKHPEKKMFWDCFSYLGVGSFSLLRVQCDHLNTSKY